MQFSDVSDGDTNGNGDDVVQPVDNGGDSVTRADFDALKREVEDLKSRVSDHDDAYELESTSDDFGGLTLREFVSELADAQYGKGVRPVRPGQFDVPDKK